MSKKKGFKVCNLKGEHVASMMSNDCKAEKQEATCINSSVNCVYKPLRGREQVGQEHTVLQPQHQVSPLGLPDIAPGVVFWLLHNKPQATKCSVVTHSSLSRNQEQEPPSRHPHLLQQKNSQQQTLQKVPHPSPTKHAFQLEMIFNLAYLF